jgi:hypothetical protein
VVVFREECPVFSWGGKGDWVVGNRTPAGLSGR